MAHFLQPKIRTGLDGFCNSDCTMSNVHKVHTGVAGNCTLNEGKHGHPCQATKHQFTEAIQAVPFPKCECQAQSPDCSLCSSAHPPTHLLLPQVKVEVRHSWHSSMGATVI
eukprot:1154318-Pelagomonas_calceolata.AAC.1